MKNAPLTCQQLVELVTQYLEGALSASESARFEAHISSCRACSTYLEQIRCTIRLMGDLSEETIPPQARDELLDLFRDWARQAPDQPD